MRYVATTLMKNKISYLPLSYDVILKQEDCIYRQRPNSFQGS